MGLQCLWLPGENQNVWLIFKDLATSQALLQVAPYLAVTQHGAHTPLRRPLQGIQIRLEDAVCRGVEGWLLDN